MNDLYDRIAEWLTGHQITTGGSLAIILTAIRVLRSQRQPTFGMVCLEGLCCGLLSMAFSYSAVHLLNVDPSVGVLIGASAGFVGLDRLKILFLAVLDRYLLRQPFGDIKEDDK